MKTKRYIEPTMFPKEYLNEYGSVFLTASQIIQKTNENITPVYIAPFHSCVIKKDDKIYDILYWNFPGGTLVEVWFKK